MLPVCLLPSQILEANCTLSAMKITHGRGGVEETVQGKCIPERRDDRVVMTLHGLLQAFGKTHSSGHDRFKRSLRDGVGGKKAAWEILRCRPLLGQASLLNGRQPRRKGRRLGRRELGVVLKQANRQVCTQAGTADLDGKPLPNRFKRTIGLDLAQTLLEGREQPDSKERMIRHRLCAIRH